MPALYACTYRISVPSSAYRKEAVQGISFAQPERSQSRGVFNTSIVRASWLPGVGTAS